MKMLITTLSAAGLVAAAALPGRAETHMEDPAAITCADFMAMDAEGQMAAVAAMQGASMEEGAMSGDVEGDDEMAESEVAEGDGMEAGEMAESGAPDESMMSEDGTAMAEDMVATVTAGCEGQPDMMAMDAMMHDM